jgi:hypothetical protein
MGANRPTSACQMKLIWYSRAYRELGYKLNRTSQDRQSDGFTAVSFGVREDQMESIGKIVMTWIYSPGDYLGEHSNFPVEDSEFTVSEGEIRVTLPERIHDGTTKSFQRIEQILVAILDSALVANNASYELRVTSINSFNPDGTVGVIMWPKNIVSKCCVESAAIKQYYQNGALVFDHEEAARLEDASILSEKARMIESLVSKTALLHNDEILKKIVSSYKKSLSNDRYVLIHLYEIRDALSTFFKGKKNAIKKLSIAVADWSAIGDLSNKAVAGSRHEGQFLEPLREPSDEALKAARTSAQRLIEAYVTYRSKKP